MMIIVLPAKKGKVTVSRIYALEVDVALCEYKSSPS
jgi:hypothetical protein